MIRSNGHHQIICEIARLMTKKLKEVLNGPIQDLIQGQRMSKKDHSLCQGTSQEIRVLIQESGSTL